jgi:hypothetical protein
MTETKMVMTETKVCQILFWGRRHLRDCVSQYNIFSSFVSDFLRDHSETEKCSCTLQVTPGIASGPYSIDGIQSFLNSFVLYLMRALYIPRT